MSICKPKTISLKLCLSCDKCGKKVTTISFYLEARGRERLVKGFYPDFTVRLCKKCLMKLNEELKNET